MIGHATVTGDPADIIDALLVRTGGDVLCPPTSDYGEWDHYRVKVSRHDVRRLVAAGLLKRGGLEADRLAEQAGWDGNADTFVAWYVETALKGLDARARTRAGDAWHQRERGDECDIPGNEIPADVTPAAALPEPLVAYLQRLICERKRQYAAEVTLALHEGRPIPACGAPWGPDVVHKITRYYRKGQQS